jgi:outer membrane protein assembly factor BamB
LKCVTESNYTDEKGEKMKALTCNVSLKLFLAAVVMTFLFATAVSLSAPGDLIRTFSDPSASYDSSFGCAVIDVDGYVFIGASPLFRDGVVYMFDPQDGTLIRTFNTPTPGYINNGGFGRTLANFQGNLLVGAFQEPSGLNIFDIYTGARLDAYPNTGFLGDSTPVVDGQQILAGAPVDRTGNRGAAYLFDGTDGTNHTTLQTYIPPVPSMHFGGAVAFVGDHVVIGASGHVDISEGNGAAFVFDRVTGIHLHTFLDPLPIRFGAFGYSIVAAGDDILIGKLNSLGIVYLYDGSTFALKREFHDPVGGANNGFGRSMAVMEDYLLIGAPAEDITGYNSGAVFLFDINTGDLLHTYLDPTPVRNGNFGTSVAFFEGNVLIGECDTSAPITSEGIPEVHLFEGPVHDPLSLLEYLKEYILEAIESGIIDPTMEVSLIAKIDSALAALVQGNPNNPTVAINNMEALINHIEAQTDNKISTEAAAEIISISNQIIEAIAE